MKLKSCTKAIGRPALMLIIIPVIISYSCKKDDDAEIETWPEIVVEKYKGYEIADGFGFTWSFYYGHIQDGTSINLTEGWIILYPDSKFYFQVYSGYTVDTWKVYEEWSDTVSGKYRFTPDSSYLIFSERLFDNIYSTYDDSCKYVCGPDTIIEYDGSFYKDHLFVHGTFKYKKYALDY